MTASWILFTHVLLATFYVSNAEYLGCYADQETNRDLPNLLGANVLTVSMCQAICGCSYKYAGIQYGKECRCGNSYGSYGPSTNCTMTCSDGETGCGGYYANSVYSVAPSDCASPACSGSEKYTWCDSSLSINTRVSALINNLTIEEKSSLLTNGMASIPRISLPAYGVWNEALHGLARDGVATSWPQVIGVSSSLNVSLWRALGVLTSTEARGKNNDRTLGGTYQGLTLWSPNVNIFRDPRWGRGQETPGEDPTISGEYATAYVSSLQVSAPRILLIIRSSFYLFLQSLT